MRDDCYDVITGSVRRDISSPLVQAQLHVDDYIEAARYLVDSGTIDGILTKIQHGVAGYWMKTFGCSRNEIDCSVLVSFLEGNSARELSIKMGVTKKNIYLRMHRAIRMIQRIDPLLRDFQDLAEQKTGAYANPTIIFRGIGKARTPNHMSIFSYRKRMSS